jgi:AraC family transcriptional regulator of adaptative response/methylated-DNA-[protein]-cysteine methyltransferase
MPARYDALMSITDYARIEQAILFIESNFRRQPPLEEIAAGVGLSPFHFQRLFRRWAGVSPKRFIQYLTANHAEGLLRQSRSLLDVTDEAGLSSPGRLHDLIVTIHGVTPGQLRADGAGLTIRFGIHPSPFGACLIAMTDRGICGLSFIHPDEREEAITALEQRWSEAILRERPGATRPMVERIFASSRKPADGPFDLFVKGTNFQIKVWEALLTIPTGAVASYQEIARRVGAPKAVRAVGTAVGQNPVSYLIPCHRIIRKSGAFGNYEGGVARKKALLGWEAARFQHPGP